MTESSAFATVNEAVEAVANAPESISRIFDLAERAVYGTGYITAFMIAFPFALICAAIPKRNALVRGMIDGTADARARAKRFVG